MLAHFGVGESRRKPKHATIADGRFRRTTVGSDEMQAEVLDDPYRLQRFVDAQRGIYARVETELRAGRKESHWMWFIFPQIKGLGQSTMAQTYAIATLAEATAYLNHPLLSEISFFDGPLCACCRRQPRVQGRLAEILSFRVRCANDRTFVMCKEFI
jgi:hypothetical protein